MFRWSLAALPISRLIEQRIRSLVGKEYLQLRIPVLCDCELHGAPKKMAQEGGVPYIFWCGMVDGYKRDPELLVRALAIARKTFPLRLVIAGPCTELVRQDLLRLGYELGLSDSDIQIVGFVADDELGQWVSGAFATVLPLWNDDRSRTRFPTKSALYACAGKPIITCAVGEIPDYFADGINAIFFEPGDPVDLSKCLISLWRSPLLSHNLGAKARETAVTRFDFRVYAKPLMELAKRVEEMRRA